MGLSLLEAAAVGGETLPVDALANALGPADHAPRGTHDRVAVAMSGGVDSAVALLKAGPPAVGVTLRLWLDPHGPDSERACCSPSAVIAARETCHARGLPHVTLDLREAFRRAVVTPFVRGYARGETPNPCIACNGGFRFAELLAFAKRVGAAKLATGHYARIVEHDGRLLLARGADPAKDQSYMLARLDPRFLDRIWFPLGEQTKDGDTCRGRGSGPRGRGARREPGSVLPRRRRLPRVSRPAGACGPSRARSSTRTATQIGTHDGFWRFTPGQRRGLGVAAAEPLYALRTDARTNTVVAGRSRGARPPSCRGPRPALRSGRPGGREAPLSLAGGRRQRRGDGPRLPARTSTSRRTASPSARPPCSTTATSSSVRV